MFDLGEEGGDVPLLAVYPAFQKLILGSFRKKQILHTKSQLLILLALNTQERLTMTQIAQYISSSNEQATRALAPLAEEGYVERSIDELNRTHVLVCLTEKGREYLQARLAELRTDLNQRVRRSLSPEEQAELRSSVYSLKRLLEKIE